MILMDVLISMILMDVFYSGTRIQRDECPRHIDWLREKYQSKRVLLEMSEFSLLEAIAKRALCLFKDFSDLLCSDTFAVVGEIFVFVSADTLNAAFGLIFF